MQYQRIYEKNEKEKDKFCNYGIIKRSNTSDWENPKHATETLKKVYTRDVTICRACNWPLSLTIYYRFTILVTLLALHMLITTTSLSISQVYCFFPFSNIHISNDEYLAFLLSLFAWLYSLDLHSLELHIYRRLVQGNDNTRILMTMKM